MMYDRQALFTHYRTNVSLVKDKYWSQTELDEMLPFERAVYIDLMNAANKNEKT
jgi:hypothetical protein